jgi:hypothetical protein
MKPERNSPALAQPRAWSRGGRTIALIACVAMLAGCGTIKGWFGGDSEKARARAR